MSTLKDLLAQQEELTKKINEVRQLERSAAISQALELIKSYQLTKSELFGKVESTSKKVRAASKVAAQYRDPISGKTWSGRGVKPKWITESGKEKSAFKITD